jgi:hypothetical protein
MKGTDTMTSKNAGVLLGDLSKLFLERNALYKDNYKKFGNILVQMFPDGITLKSPEEFNRFALFLQIIHKQTRYAHSVLDGGHADSLDDTSVYAQLLQEFDNDCREARAQAKQATKARKSS